MNNTASTLLISLLTFANVGAQDNGFVPLFNGRNLDGWVRVNTDESTWTVKDGMLMCTGKPTGELRTTKMYQNFIMEVEWRHMKPRGNAGIFVWADDITARGVPFHRSIEVQVLENAYGNTRGYTTHGDIFPIHGAKMEPINGRGGSRAFPTENRSNPSPEWNHYRIECRGGEVSLAVNGKVVTRGKKCLPSKGYICIESEGGVVHYRNMKIRELPDTPITAKQTAVSDRGYRCLYTGVDLRQWHADARWKSNDWQLQYTGDASGITASNEKFGDVGFIFDFKVAKGSGSLEFAIGGVSSSIEVADDGWHRVEGKCEKGKLTYTVVGKSESKHKAENDPKQGSFTVTPPSTTTLANIYVREL